MSGIFGIHEKALMVQTRRAEMIANNIVNADTPGYKAADLNFRQILAEADGVGAGNDVNLIQSRQGHLPGILSPALSLATKYRLNAQPSVDGNTVDLHVEKGEYMKNAQRMQATLRFLDDRISGIRKALRGQ
jgi:flagellar basal-body rod protein FlgB